MDPLADKPAFSITAESPSHPAAVRIISAHLAQMAGQSPAESCHALGAEALDGPDTRFFLLWQEGRAIAMGALKTLGADTMELKSMHTLATARGSGAGRAMLAHLIATARAVGARKLYLETGSTDDFMAARALYAAHGFRPTEPFAAYVCDPWSIFMALDL